VAYGDLPFRRILIRRILMQDMVRVRVRVRARVGDRVKVRV